MIAAPHMIVGAILGDLIQNYPLAFLAGFASHFVFDAIPHLETSTFLSLKERQDGNRKLTKKEYLIIISEFSLGLFIVYWFFLTKSKNLAILWGAFGAILPDLIDNVPFWKYSVRKIQPFKWFHQFHDWIHYNKLNSKNWIFGLPIYIIIIGIFIWIIFN